MKKIFTLLVAMLLVPWVGWGQETITINTAKDLRDFAEEVNGNTDEDASWNVVLGTDINLEGEDNPWTPIDNFKGTFDGKGYSISNIYIEQTLQKHSTSSFGLFGLVEGTIQNLNVENSNIKVIVGDYTSTAYIGGIAGRVGSYGKILNCSFAGTIDAEANNAKMTGLSIGGICGEYENDVIESCYNAGTINVSIKSISFGVVNPGGTLELYISGICNTPKVESNTLNIENSYNTGSINVSVNGFKHSQDILYGLSVSGIAHGNKSNITSCYNTGEIKVSGSNGCIMKINGIGDTTNEINYCYNIGTIETTGLINTGETAITMYGSISGSAGATYNNNYYFPQDGINAVGGNNDSYNNKEGEIESATLEQFSSGEIAHALREGGYGQSLDANGDYQNNESSPVLLAFFSENKGKEVYQLNLSSEDENITIPETPIYRNAIESNLLPQETYEEIMADAAEGQDLVWTTSDNKVFSGNSYKVTKDETLTGELKGVYNINTVVTPEGAGEIDVKETAANGEKVSFSLGINDGYKLLSVTMNGEILTDEDADNIYTFTMPAADVTITATFEKTETGGDDDEEGSISTKRYQLFLADRDFYLNDKYDAEGLVLFSRHDKRYAEVGGSFTVYYEKDGEMNAGDYRIFWSKSANGEYKEVKLDEVSGYYQIRNVQSDVYVKIYSRDGFPVSNEAIEATEARAYAQANKIIVVTHEPMDVQIVSMAGAVVGNAKVAGQQEFGNLAEGVYIVRLGETVVKLQVRN